MSESKGGWARRPVVAARAGLLALLVLLPAAALLGLLLGGGAGARAALLGLSVPAAVLLITWATAELGAGRSPSAFVGLLLASFGVKLVAVAGLLEAIGRSDVGNRAAVAASAVAGLLVALVVEATVVARTRAPYVEP